MIALTTYCTKSYAYAIEAQIPLAVAAIQYADVGPGIMVLSGDDSAAVDAAFGAYGKAMKRLGWKSERVVVKAPDGGNGAHKKETNLGIAAMQQAAWHVARCEGAEAVWSLESDVLPGANTLRSMLDVLRFDRGWYDVAMCAYGNESILGGKGTPANWILPTVYDSERELSAELLARIAARDERRAALSREAGEPTADDSREWAEIDEAVKASPAKGNVFHLQGQGWKPRGWFESAYPGIGQGAMVPTDWVGLGCTLISAKALALANWTGFDGGSTQDLWLVWRCWQPEGIRMAMVPHATCGHVKVKDGKKRLIAVRHELGGAQHGHLRTTTLDWNGL